MFPKFLTFKFATFSKNQQIGELFQKRFATGICDLRGAPAMYSATPYTPQPKRTLVALQLSLMRLASSGRLSVAGNPPRDLGHPVLEIVELLVVNWISFE